MERQTFFMGLALGFLLGIGFATFLAAVQL